MLILDEVDGGHIIGARHRQGRSCKNSNKQSETSTESPHETTDTQHYYKCRAVQLEGYAMAVGELQPNFSAVGAAVQDSTEVIASLSLGSPIRESKGQWRRSLTSFPTVRDMDTYAQETFITVAIIDTNEWATFIMRTYIHLFGAILLFALIEVFLFKSGLAAPMAEAMLGVSWLIVLGGFIVVSWFTSRAVHRVESPLAQYAALIGFVIAEAIIFVPLLFVAAYYAGPGIINSTAWVMVLGFSGLTAMVFFTRKDFSFLGGMLRWAFVVALVLIVVSVLFGFELYVIMFC